MGIRFSKSIKLGSLLKLNVSKSGISATVGKKGASINLGANGTYLNLSPSIAGIKGTGLSYRQKIAGGYKDAASKLIKKDDKKITKEEKEDIDTSIIDEYEKEMLANMYPYKYTDDVNTKEEFDNNINELKSESSKEIYKLCIDGDEETVESLIGSFLNKLELSYDVDANYELEDHDLYVDLDLPEIEDFKDEYPCLSNNKIINKKKTNLELKEEYSKTVLGLGIYLVANFFNISSYIDRIILSAFTSRRNNDGDLIDEYLYSIKFDRNILEKTKLEEINDPSKFILKFENRINLSTSYVFKAIKPYETIKEEKINKNVEDALLGLKELGYKANDINNIKDELIKLDLYSSSDYLKAAIKIMNNK